MACAAGVSPVKSAAKWRGSWGLAGSTADDANKGGGVEVRGEGRGAEKSRDTRRETRVERESEHVARESERHAIEREHVHTRVQRGGVCLLYRGTRRFEE